MKLFSSLLLLAFALVGCGSDSNDGSAPTIANLSLSPDSVPVGTPSTISGTADFRDPDADAAKLAVEITLPSGQKQALPRSDLQNAAGMTEGPLQVALFLSPPSAGVYTIELFIVDAKGRESNRLTTTITAK